jgi:outer membrane protein assembly factor BamB
MKQIFTLVGLSIFLVSGNRSDASDWPHWRGPDFNGISRETGWLSKWPAQGPTVLWKASVGTGFSSFAVADGRVYTMGNEENRDSVVCLDEGSGRDLWRHDYPEPKAPKLYEGGPNATPTVNDDRVFSLSRNGKLFCLEADSGKVVWSQDLMADFGIQVPDKGHWGLSGSPVVQGQWVIVNAGRAGMAFDRESGKLVWQTGRDPAGYATPVPCEIGGHRAVLVFAAKALMAVALADGRELWQYPWETSWDVNAADPMIDGQRIFITSGYNRGAAVLQLKEGRPHPLWENKNMRSQMSGGVLWQGHVYGIDDKQLRCLALDTGEVRWTDKSSGKGSVTMAEGKLIVLSEKGELLVADASPEGFQSSARAQVLGGKCWTVPVLANGRLYARNAAGDVVCLDLTQK